MENYENPLFIGVSRDLYIKSVQRFFHHKDRSFPPLNQGNDLPFFHVDLREASVFPSIRILITLSFDAEDPMYGTAPKRAWDKPSAKPFQTPALVYDHVELLKSQYDNAM